MNNCSKCHYSLEGVHHAKNPVGKGRMCEYCIERVDIHAIIPNNKKQYLGLELEVICRNSDKLGLSDSWYQKYDGSLSCYGTEIVLVKPQTYNGLIKSVSRLSKRFEREHAVANESCGYHIHLNTKFKSKSQIKRFISLCIQTQYSVFSLCKPSRAESVYCQQLHDDVNHLYVHGRKYNWLNTQGIKTRHTIEIRQHHGTTDKEEIIRWVELWSKVFTYVTNTTSEIDCDDILTVAKMAGVSRKTIAFYHDKRREFA